MSDKTNLKISKLYSISDLKGYLYKKRSYDNLWRYHDMEHLHDHKGTCEPEIIEVQNTEEDIERYPEITYNILDLKPDKPGKHDKFAPVSRIHGQAPELGLEVIELSDYYSVGTGENKLTSGLFIYKVELSSVSYFAGLKVGDVITEIKRPQLEKIPSFWKRCHLDYDEVDSNLDSIKPQSMYRTYRISTVKDMMTLLDRMRNNEKVILTVWRDGFQMEVEMTVPFVNKIYTEFDTPKITIKRIPYMCIEDKNWNMYTYEDDEWLAKAYRRITCDVEVESGNLVVDMPDTLVDVRFYIDEEGNLRINYD